MAEQRVRFNEGCFGERRADLRAAKLLRRLAAILTAGWKTPPEDNFYDMAHEPFASKKIEVMSPALIKAAMMAAGTVEAEPVHRRR